MKSRPVQQHQALTRKASRSPLTAIKPCLSLGMVLSALMAFAAPAAMSQIITHIDQNFDAMSVGPLTTGNGWAISSGITSEIVASPSVSGNAAQFTRVLAGANSLNTNGGPNTALSLAANKSYKFNMDIRMDSLRDVATTGTYIYLMSANSNQVFANALIAFNSLGTLDVFVYDDLLNTGGVNAFQKGNMTQLTETIIDDTWYNLNMAVTTNASNQIGYEFTLTGNSQTLTHTVALQDNTVIFDGTSTVRVGWSPVNTNQRSQYDNILLQTIPEPSTALLFGLGGMYLLFFARKRHA